MSDGERILRRKTPTDEARMDVSMQWNGGMKFSAVSEWGHPVTLDAARASGGEESGFRPTEMLLWAVAGCTGIDIVRILAKKRQELESLEICVHAEQAEDYPRPFHTVQIHYVARGKVDPKALADAIALSESKYCIVSQTLQEPATVTTSFEVS